MANTSSARKAARQAVRRTEINKSRTSRMKLSVRKVEEAVASGDKAAAKAALAAAEPILMRASQKGDRPQENRPRAKFRAWLRASKRWPERRRDRYFLPARAHGPSCGKKAARPIEAESALRGAELQRIQSVPGACASTVCADAGQRVSRLPNGILTVERRLFYSAMRTRPVAPNPVDESVVFPIFSDSALSYPPPLSGTCPQRRADVDRPGPFVLQTSALGGVD